MCPLLTLGQYANWSPSGHKLVWVSNDKNLYFQTGESGWDTNSVQTVTNDGGWCIDEPRIMGTVYEGNTDNCIVSYLLLN